MIGEINDPQDVHMGGRKAKLLRALNMMLGQIFSGLIPIRPLKIHLVHPTLSMKASSSVKSSQKGEKNPASLKQDRSSFVSISLPQ